MFGQNPLKISNQFAFGGSAYDHLREILPAPDGGFFLICRSASGQSGNKTTAGYGKMDLWILRLDSSLKPAWQIQLGGTAEEDAAFRSLAAPDGSLLVLASSFSGVSGNKAEGNRGGSDVWAVKLGPDGQVQWQATLGGDKDDWPVQAAQTPDGGYLLACESRSSVSGDRTEAQHGHQDVWLLKLSKAGKLEWQESFGTRGEKYMDGLIPGPEGTFYLGYSGWDQDRGDKNHRNGWLARIDEKGNVRWDVALLARGEYETTTLCTAQNGDVLVAGCNWYLEDNLRPESSQDLSAGFGDLWVWRISPEGKVVWENGAGGEGFEGFPIITPTPDDGFILISSSDSPKSGDKLEPNRDPEKKTSDSWIVKFSAQGQLEWSRTLGGSGQEKFEFCEYDQTALPTPNGGYLITLYSNSPADGDRTTACMNPKKRSKDIWLVELSATGRISGQLCVATQQDDAMSAFLPLRGGRYLLALSTAAGVEGDKTLRSFGEEDIWLVVLETQ